MDNENDMHETPEESAGRKLTHTAGKAAAGAVGGKIGSTIYNAASKTKVGQALEKSAGRAFTANPLNRGMMGRPGMPKKPIAPQNAGMGSSLPKETLQRDGLKEKEEDGSGSSSSGGKSSPLSKLSGKDSNSESSSSASGQVDASAVIFSFFKKHWLKIVPALGGALVPLLIILGVIGVILGPAQTVIDFFQNGWDKLKTFVGYKSEERWETDYYKKLREVQEKMNDIYNVCIDVNLITATLTVDKHSDIMTTKEGLDEVDSDGKEFDYDDTPDYKKMIKQIEILANMQVKRQVYGLDEEFREANAKSRMENKPSNIEYIGEAYCADESKTYTYPYSYWDEEGTSPEGKDTLLRRTQFTLTPQGDILIPVVGKVWASLKDKLAKADLEIEGIPIRDSTSLRLVASNDLTPGVWKLLTKKANEERNIEYLFHVPAYEISEKTDSEGNVVRDANGNVIIQKKCNPTPPQDVYDFAQLDLGELNEMESVYYWNLMDSFIADYYKEYLPEVNGPLEQGSENFKTVEKIVSDIYLLYHEMGPNQMCQTKSYICRDDEGSEYYGGSDDEPLSQTDFMQRLAPLAIEEMNRTGVAASVTIAQGVLESQSGSSGLSRKYSNYYGMTSGCAPKGKDPQRYQGTVYAPGEGGNTCKGNNFWDGTIVAMCNSRGEDCQWYRVYDSLANSTRDHSRLLRTSRYQSCVGSAYEQIQCIKANGYATDSKYVDSVMRLINQYNLTEYDIGNWNGEIPGEDGNPQYTNRICNQLGTATGDWANWKQNHGGWENVALGPSTVGKIGCAMTSVAIQIMRAGVPTTLGENFNPGTFAEALAKVGGFDERGNIDWDAVTKIAPNFQSSDRGFSTTVSQIDSFVRQGYYVILNVKNGKHWVAVDRVEGDKVYMFDPGSGGTEVGQTYGLGSIVGYKLYKKV